MTKRIKLPRHGQAEGREERIKKYEEFTGAKLVVDAQLKDIGGRKHMHASTRQEADKHTKLIRESLTFGVDQIICSVSDRAVYDLILHNLTVKEIKRVHFPFFDVPRPTTTVEL